MTSYLGWSTHKLYDDQWAVMAGLLKADDPRQFFWYPGRNLGQPTTDQRQVAYLNLTEMGILREEGLPNGVGYEFTERGRRFAEELLPERFRDVGNRDAPDASGERR